MFYFTNSHIAYARCPESPSGQSSAPRVQTASAGERGGAVRRQEPHGVLRSEPAVQLQHTRELLRAVADGAASERHGKAMEE